MNDRVVIVVRRDFSDAPGARYRKEGPHSGEEFYETLLRPKYEEAVDRMVPLVIDLDGVWGYPSSFVSGSFGKLSIEYGVDNVLKVLVLQSTESKTRKDRIISEIKKPERGSR